MVRFEVHSKSSKFPTEAKGLTILRVLCGNHFQILSVALQERAPARPTHRSHPPVTMSSFRAGTIANCEAKSLIRVACVKAQARCEEKCPLQER